ncbi:DUF4113 domain-containing protein [Candidatus Sororendozoicomonas aggregata]|uniref:DUF4113 domain-containing protein n=1 Tax=Candidatus Sororendozoicomonas aggregata TaxID=3073239 RepID=UPI003B75C2EC
MTIVDEMNKKYGKQKLRPASAGLGKKQWRMKQNALSPRYTTCWQDIMRTCCR